MQESITTSSSERDESIGPVLHYWEAWPPCARVLTQRLLPSAGIQSAACTGQLNAYASSRQGRHEDQRSPGLRGLMAGRGDLADGLMVPGGACCVAIQSRDCGARGGMPHRGRRDSVAGVCRGRMLGFHEGSTFSRASRPWPGEKCVSRAETARTRRDTIKRHAPDSQVPL